MGEQGLYRGLIKTLLAEDWLAVLIAFSVILLAVLGIFGKTGLNITF